MLVSLLGQEETESIFAADPLIGRAAGAAAAYAGATRPKGSLPIERFIIQHHPPDETAKSHLELTQTASGNKKGSLLRLIDKTRTGMGTVACSAAGSTIPCSM